MMDAKALLDSLMGPSRDKAKKDKKDDEWKAENVCKRYLVGFCPTNENDNLFQNAKRGISVCVKLHSERLKEDFDKHPDRKKYRKDYETELLNFIDGLISDADARGAREKQICRPGGGEPVIRLTEGQKLKYERLQKEAAEAMSLAEQMAEEGNIKGSKAASEQARKISEDMDCMKGSNSFIPKGDVVCDVCGMRFSIDDDCNWDGHHASNLHIAYMKIREKVKEIRDAIERRKAEGGVEDKPADCGRGDSRRNDRGKDERGRDEKPADCGRGDSRRDDTRGRDERDRDRREERPADSGRGGGRDDRDRDRRDGARDRRERDRASRDRDRGRDRYARRDRSRSRG